MRVSPKVICSGIGSTILILLLAACGGDPTVAPASTNVPQVEAQPTATSVPTPAPTPTVEPTFVPEPTATPLPIPTLGPTATATPRIIMGIVRPTPTPAPTPTPLPDLDVLRQNLPPQIILGTVTIDGSPAPDGTVVRALVDGVEVASVQVMEGKYPRLDFLTPAQTVTFMIGDLTAAETFVTTVGGIDMLNLTATRPSMDY